MIQQIPSQAHTFHIPVMGLGYTIDTPARVAHLGISSVISIVDDVLIENMREFYCKNLNIPFKAISTKIHDFRAKRITEYLDLMDEVVKEKFEALKYSVSQTEHEIEKYLAMLPEMSDLKRMLQQQLRDCTLKSELIQWLDKNLRPGSIDVNIMTKVDKENYIKGEKLPVEYNDAHAALRGFANSKLNSSLVLSAGMNPRLYSYLEAFDDFYPTETGFLKKKIILKVSDYRSALIQGKYLAKKGIWVSEYRIESGLNCGGHAFASNGMLLGPILQEVKENRDILSASLHDLLSKALEEKNRPCPKSPLPLRITVQGGVGTSEEHRFLIDHYGVDSVGWGTPFLLVSEAVMIDEETQDLLAKAKEDDLYLSNVSPLGVPFNNVRGNTKDLEKAALITSGKPGSLCPKRYLVLDREFTDIPICTASKHYQKLKLNALKESYMDEYDAQQTADQITEKTCLCVGLSNSALIAANVKEYELKPGVTVCPGPNMAYFSEKVSLKKMVDHIYGRVNIITRNDRPNLFIKELTLYANYLKDQIGKLQFPVMDSEIKSLQKFRDNLLHGIQYYKDLFANYAQGILNKEINEPESLDEMEQDISQLVDELAV